MPFSIVFSLLQLSLLLFLISTIHQQGLINHHKNLSETFVQMEKASRVLLIEMISRKGHIPTSQWISQQVTYWWDLDGDNCYDSVSVFSNINLKSTQIEWVAVHFVLEEKYAMPIVLPLFETRISSSSNRKVKMINHKYVCTSKAVYHYIYDISINKLSASKISIPTNENY
jgi:hypothetical protein